jgi:CRP-like cAMP-binding protein
VSTPSSNPQDISRGNFLLSSLPAAAQERLLPHLETVELKSNEVLYQTEACINHVYFPLDAVVSGLAIMMDGATTEIVMTGREGMVGIMGVISGGRAQHWTRVQVAGTALRMKTEEMASLFHADQIVLRAVLSAYRSMIAQISQRAVCNARHTLRQRLCCWLLMIHDRVGRADLALTQEIMASRLGGRRAGVTVAAGALQGMRAIKYSRGRIHIEGRAAIESAACECYAVQAREFKSFQAQTESGGTNPLTCKPPAESRQVQDGLKETARKGGPPYSARIPLASSRRARRSVTSSARDVRST